MRGATALLLVCASTGSCQLFVEPDTLSGIGAPCDKDTECHASQCLNGVCTLPCEGADECPEGTQCTSEGNCQLTMRVAFVLPPSGAAQDWTTAHALGAEAAVKGLPYVAQATVFDGADTAEEAAGFVQQAIGDGYHAIFAASSDFNGVMAGVAGTNPAVQFFTCGGGGSGNHHGYYGRLYEAWYIAGRVAAQKSTAKRLGVVGSYVTPAVVRHINAFARGARSIDETAVVEVRWMGEWIDPTPDPEDEDRTLALELVDSGCDVIAYHGYKRSAASAISEVAAMGVSVIGNNFEQACDDPKIDNCIGTVYWNWAPLYRGLIELAHKQQLGSGDNFNSRIDVDPAQSVPNFKVVDPAQQMDVDAQRAALADSTEVGPIFTGPFCTNGMQRDPACVPEGQAIMNDELNGMCWFVEGVVERDPMDAMLDIPALVPSEGDCGG